MDLEEEEAPRDEGEVERVRLTEVREGPDGAPLGPRAPAKVEAEGVESGRA